MVETCFDNKYARMVTEPVLDFTEKSLDYILPSASVYDGTAQNTLKRIYNINKRVYKSVYETTFIQLSKLHLQFENTIKKLQSLKKLMDSIYADTKTKLIEKFNNNSLVSLCNSQMEKNNISVKVIFERNFS